MAARRLRAAALAAGVVLGAAGPAAAQFEFDAASYFPLDDDSQWNFVDESGVDAFAWRTVVPGVDVGGGATAARIRQLPPDPPAGADGDEQYWRINAANDLVFHGFRVGQDTTTELDGTTATILAQSVLIDPPLRFGGDGQRIGDTVVSTGDGSIRVRVSIFTITVPFTATSTVVWEERLESFETPAGAFEDVVRASITIEIEGTVSIPFVGTTEFQDTLQDNLAWFAPGVGIVAQEPDGGTRVVLRDGVVGGVPIEGAAPPPPSLPSGWVLF